MRTLNLGILAHVDAGKTSLTERLLFAAGVIDEMGRVDDGNTQTDSMALERQRGITIKSAVVSFVLDDVTVNLIDTPGHPDFIAEVERALRVLDGTVLVVSAVEGVQAQTRVLMRALRRLGIPTLIFVNKIDRPGARQDAVVAAIAEKLAPGAIAMGSTSELGTQAAAFVPHGAANPGRLAERLAEHDDALLAAYVSDEASVPYVALRKVLAAQTRAGRVHPVFFGSAVTGAGVECLLREIPALLPNIEGDAAGPLSATVLKFDRGPGGEKIAYVRMFSGTLRARDRIPVGPDSTAKVTAIHALESGAAVQRPALVAGQIGKVQGLGELRIGDAIGTAHTHNEPWHFAPPALETVIAPRRGEDKGALRLALSQLAGQDPLINVRQDDLRQEIFVSLYGEVQKEVIEETLATDFNVEVEFRETTTICIERPVGTGASFELIKKKGNPFLATVGLRIEPGAIGSGVTYRLEVELGSLPAAFHKAVEETVGEALEQGLQGWRVTDCIVTMTHSAYWPRQSHSHGRFDKSMSSTAGAFRDVTPLVLMDALKQAGTQVHEPIQHFRLEVPMDCLGPLLPVLASLHAIPETPAVAGAHGVVEGEIPAAQMQPLQRRLPGLSRGEGVLESSFSGYQPIRGEVPTRPRWDLNPLDRRLYFLNVEKQRGGR